MTTATTQLIDPVGPQEIAERLEVTTATVHSWRNRAKTAVDRIPMPEPDVIISNTPIWSWETIATWAEQTRRIPQPNTASYQDG